MVEEERLDTYLGADTIIEMIKAQHGIKTPNPEMTDEEIAKVMRFLGSGAPDTVWVDGEPMRGRTGIGIMLSLTLYQFPDFYDRHGLSQFN